MSPKRRTELSIELALLGFLYDQPLHGYEIYQRLGEAQALGLVWHLKQPHLYALLGKLEADGLIAAEVQPQEGRPPKRLLHLTPAGREAFTRWIATPVAHGRDLRIEFLAKLFWAQQRNPLIARHLIDAQRSQCHAWLAELIASDDQAETNPYVRLVHEFRRTQIEAMLRWLDVCADTIIITPVSTR